MKRFIVILAFFCFMLNPCYAKQVINSQEITTSSMDGFTIKSTLLYPKSNTQKEYSTVVLLHSLGYSSDWWGTLPEELLESGFAVLKIDLRGHGKSVYNAKLSRVSWSNMTKNAYIKYPEDVIKVIEQVKSENSIKFFNKWAVVGADIGAGTAILAVDKLDLKPKTMVLLSPIVETKGLYVPVKLAQMNNIDVFSISGTQDKAGKNAEEYLKRFAQSTFVTYTSESATNGILMLHNDPTLSKIITMWIRQYL